MAARSTAMHVLVLALLVCGVWQGCVFRGGRGNVWTINQPALAVFDDSFRWQLNPDRVILQVCGG